MRSAIHAGKVGWFHVPLDLAAMQAAAQCLVGEHDFSAFRAAECQAKSPVKHLRRLDISRHGDMLIFEFDAPMRSCITWCATSSAAWCMSAKGKYIRRNGWAEILGRPRAHVSPRRLRAAGLYLPRVECPAEWGLHDGAAVGAVPATASRWRF